MIHIRPAGPADARTMAELLNAIIAKGGTTAMTEPVSAEKLAEWMAQGRDRSAWHLAEDDAGALLGFQWIDVNASLPPEACDISTFVALGQTGLGIGSKLFDATKAAAKRLGFAWINANIRADNAGGLAYYQSRGFEDWKRVEGVALADGQRVTKIFKRYDLG